MMQSNKKNTFTRLVIDFLLDWKSINRNFATTKYNN